MITYHPEITQGSEEWRAARCGLLTASEMHLMLTPSTLKASSNDKERAHVAELAAQRITKYVEPSYVSDDMLRGMDDEIAARAIYAKAYAPLETVGFITSDKLGFPIGYSPDAKLVGQNAGIEVKSRRQRFQMETICNLAMPTEYAIQLQTGLLVSEWEWIDFVSYSSGMPMVTMRIFPDEVIQKAIASAAKHAEERIALKIAQYTDVIASGARLIPTERRIYEEMHL